MDKSGQGIYLREVSYRIDHLKGREDGRLATPVHARDEVGMGAEVEGQLVVAHEVLAVHPRQDASLGRPAYTQRHSTTRNQELVRKELMGLGL